MDVTAARNGSGSPRALRAALSCPRLEEVGLFLLYAMAARVATKQLIPVPTPCLRKGLAQENPHHKRMPDVRVETKYFLGNSSKAAGV